MFVTSRNLLFGVYLPRKIITILRKIAVNFRQVSLKEILPSVSVLECFGEKVGSLKILYCTWTSSQVIFKVSSRIFFFFFHLFTFPLIYRSLYCVKSVQIRSYFWSVFPRIRTEYGEIRSISSYSVRMWGNADQK